MISVRGVTKRYGTTTAVDDVSFTAAAGSITYLLGPNGAGKTTVMRMIAGLTRPDSGRVTIDDAALPDLRNPLSAIGFGLGPFLRNPRHTAERHLLWQARLGGLGPAEVRRSLDRVGLTAVAKRPVGKFSYGMSQRLNIASALLGTPRTLVLDEPANGLDVEGILWLRALVTELASAGHCLLIASHNLAEVEITGDRIVVLGRGKVLSDSPARELIERGSGPRRLESAYLELTTDSAEYGQEVRA
ncbi:ABC transporter ATP-binding protein [Nocardia lasii]|uniref:ABC transporter ATP-binding protein n=1 Tax=Nocardia lasii TaxID=1616107 RepID=A0ABW1JZY3_9NOCA